MMAEGLKPEKKVLILNDKPDELLRLNTALSKHDTGCDIITQPEYVLPKLVDGQYDAVFLDLELQSVDVLSILKEIRTNSKYDQLPVIMLTADSPRSVLRLCFRSGATDTIDKFVTDEVLEDHLARILENRDITGSLEEQNLKLHHRLEEETLHSLQMESGMRAIKEDQEKWRVMPDEIKDVLDSLLIKFETHFDSFDQELKETLIRITAQYGNNISKFLELAHRIKSQTDQEYQECISLLKEIHLFKDLSSFDLYVMAESMQSKEFIPGEYLLHQNRAAESVFFISTGTVGVLVNGELVAHRQAGDSIGEMSCLRGEEEASASVVATTLCKIWYIDRESFLAIFDQFPILWRKVFYEMTDRFTMISQRKSELLRHSREGLIKLDREGKITDEFSSRCVEIFESPDLIEKNFSQLLMRDEKMKADWHELYPMLFQDTAIGCEPLLDMLPKEVEYIDSSGSPFVYELFYYPCHNQQGEVGWIDVGIKDITVQKILEREQEKLAREKESLSKVYEDPESFLGFMELSNEIMSLLEPLHGHDLPLEEKRSLLLDMNVKSVMRKLHSLKGLSGLFLLNELKQASHEMETQINDLTKPVHEGIDGEIFDTCLLQLNELILRANELINNLGEKMKKRLTGVVMEKDQFRILRETLTEGNIDQARNLMEELDKVSLKDIFQHWKQETQRLSEQLGKQATCIIEGDNPLIQSAMAKKLSSSLIHILRNSLDHGLESANQRDQAGKLPQGTIRVEIDSTEKSCQIEFSDDGKGIDFDVVLTKVKNNTALNTAVVNDIISRNQLAELLFLPGFTSKEQTTDLSGRGVGLDAVKHAVEELGGTLTMESKLGQGTRFFLKIPIPV